MAGTGADPDPRGPGDACGRGAADRRRGPPRAWGPGAEWALEQAPDLLERPGQPGRLRAETSRARRDPPPPPARPPGPERAGHGVPGAGDHRAEEARPGGLCRLPDAGPPVRRAGPRSGRRPPAVGAADRRAAAGDSLLELAGCTSTPRGHVPWSPSPWSAASLERLATRGPKEFDAGVRSIPGIGARPSAEVRQRSLGDPDAVSFGDYHVAKDVGWALTGTPFDDDRLAEFLEPWRPQRAECPPWWPWPGSAVHVVDRGSLLEHTCPQEWRTVISVTRSVR